MFEGFDQFIFFDFWILDCLVVVLMVWIGLHEIWALILYIERIVWSWFQCHWCLARESPELIVFLVNLCNFWTIGMDCWIDCIAWSVRKGFVFNFHTAGVFSDKTGISPASGGWPKSGNNPGCSSTTSVTFFTETLLTHLSKP